MFSQTVSSVSRPTTDQREATVNTNLEPNRWLYIGLILYLPTFLSRRSGTSASVVTYTYLGPIDMPEKCQFCDQTFARKSNLARHVNCTHRGTKPFKCPNCGKEFEQKILLEDHVKSDHKGTKKNISAPSVNISIEVKAFWRTTSIQFSLELKTFNAPIVNFQLAVKGS